jgi:hypothetical protein
MAYKVKVGKFTVECDSLQEVKSLIADEDEKPTKSTLSSVAAKKAWVTRRQNKTHRRTKNADKRWSKDDIITVKSAYENNKGLRMKRKSMNKLKNLLHRSKASICSKAHELGFTKIYKPNGKPMKAGTVLSRLKNKLSEV